MKQPPSSTARRHFIRTFGRAVVTVPLAGAITAAMGGCASAPKTTTAANSLTTLAGPARESAMASATPAGYGRLLILVELKGGNDGLNTLIPYHDPAYYALRPKIAIARDAVVPVSDRCGLHPALQPLLALWNRRELALLQGVGYPAPNLSHFRSIEIWDTASRSDQYLPNGWLTRTFARTPPPRDYAADGFVIGSYDLGPLDGGARALTLADAAQFNDRARFARAEGTARTPALEHILRTESDIVQAAAQLRTNVSLATRFPASPFGNAVRTACNVIARAKGVAVVRLTLNGFDTHANQAPTQARLLAELAEGLVALEQGLTELHRWDDTLILTYAEFGRRPRENLSGGTDHGTSNVHFAMGGRVVGGLYGAQPGLGQLSTDGNLAHAIDFRSVYATALDRWWGLDSRNVLGGRFETLPIVRA
jgi:uncharacterized protein (DUF1501 family)